MAIPTVWISIVIHANIFSPSAVISGVFQTIPLLPVVIFIISTFYSTACNSFHIEFLHDHKQNRNRYGYQYTTCAELSKIRIDKALIQHLVQTNGNCIFGRNTGIQDHLCIYEIHPWHQETADNCINNNRAAHGQNHLEEDSCLTASINSCSLAECSRNCIKESFRNQLTKT